MTARSKVFIAVILVVVVGAAAIISLNSSRSRGAEVRVEGIEARDLVAKVIASGNIRARVQVDQEVVGKLSMLHAGRPRVEIDAAEVGDPRQGCSLSDDGEVGGSPARELDVDALHPLRMRLRNALLIEESLSRAVRIALHQHGSARHVIEHLRRE